MKSKGSYGTLNVLIKIEYCSLVGKTGIEYTLSEIRTLNIIICEKLTRFVGLNLIFLLTVILIIQLHVWREKRLMFLVPTLFGKGENTVSQTWWTSNKFLKFRKSAEWLELYTDAVYEVFSKLSRNAREEERVEVWERLKVIKKIC